MRTFLIVMVLALTSPLVALAQQSLQQEDRLPDRKLSGAGINLMRLGGGKSTFVPVEKTRESQEYMVPLKEVATTVEGAKVVQFTVKQSAPIPVYLDEVVMKIGNKTFRPIRATADGKDVTAKLRAKDDDCSCFAELTLEFPAPKDQAEIDAAEIAFIGSANDEASTVAFPSQREAPRIVQTSKFYDYKMGSRAGALMLDGQFTPEDQLGKPAFKEKSDVAVGKDKKPIQGWVMDNGAELSIALDVASDNTVTDADDKTILYVRGKGPLASFVAGPPGEAYGRMGTAYTDAAKHEHRIYEFRIPFEKLSAPENGKWGIAFAVTM